MLSNSILFAEASTIQVEAIFSSQAELVGLAPAGLDSTTTPGDLLLPNLDISADPARETRNVAVLAPDPAALDTDLDFILSAYFPNFSYDGGGSDDVFALGDVDEASDLAGYDILIVDAGTGSESDQLHQEAIDAFADVGGTVVENMLGYSRQRQTQAFPIESGFFDLASAAGGMAYDGTYMWQADDTSPERIRKIDLSDGSTVATYCAPNSVPRGMEFVSGTLYIADSASEKLHAVNPASLTAYDGSCSSPEQGTVYDLADLSPAPTSPWGLTHDGTNFWLNDSVSDNLYSFTISGASLVQGSVTDLNTVLKPMPNSPLPRGLAYDGSDLWYADVANNVVYQLELPGLAVGRVVDAWDGWTGYLDADPTGIAFVDGDLWLNDTDATADRTYNLFSYHQTLNQFEYLNRTNDSIRTPGDEPYGLAYDGTNFWILDDYENRLYKMNASGAVLSSCLTPSVRPKDLAYSSGTLYLSDSFEDRIYLLDPSDCSVTSSYASPSTLPRGLAHDGTSLWHVDSDSDTVYELNPATGAVLSSFASPDSSPRGLGWDGTYLWLIGESSNDYFLIDPSSGTTVKTVGLVDQAAEGIDFVSGRPWSVDPVIDRVVDVYSGLLAEGQFDSPGGSPAGFVYDGTYIWHADTGTDRIYKLNYPAGTAVSSFAAPAADPHDLAWDGSSLWVACGPSNTVYEVNPSTGATLSSFVAPGSEVHGVTYTSGTTLYLADPISNKIYEVNTSGTLAAAYSAPSSASEVLAYDGSHVWNYDYDDRIFYKFEFADDEEDHEGIVAEAVEGTTTRVKGMDFIDGNLWSADSYFDSFFSSATASDQPEAQFQVANGYTVPYQVGDRVYLSSRSSSDAIYLHRRLLNLPETASRTSLADSSRGGSLLVHEERTNGGHIFTMDLTLVNDNYEVSRQTVPAITLFLNCLGIQVNANGVHENSRPTYDQLLSDLNDLVAANPTVISKSAFGTASSGDTIWGFDMGTEGKPIAYFNSGIHGNEEHAFIPTVRYIEHLVSLYNSNDPTVRNVLANYRLKFTPLTNVWGIKNGSRFNMNGVDLNRNFDYNWDTYVSSSKGSAAFSEPESQAIRDYVLANASNIIFSNDAHSARGISPGFIYADGVVLPDDSIMADTQDIFFGQNEWRWYEEKAGVGRWLTYDRSGANLDRPYTMNWISAQGIYGGTTEVMGKLDIGTERMIHTSAWYFTHYDSVMQALSARVGRTAYRVDTEDEASFFTDDATVAGTLPAGSSVTFRYASSSAVGVPEAWNADYSAVDAGRYLFVEAALGRSTHDGTTPDVESVTVSYGRPGTSVRTSSNRATLSRLKAGAENVDFSLQFTLPEAQSTPLTVTFDPGFTVNSAFTSGTCAGGGTISNFGFTASTLTADKSACDGTVTLTGALIDNPSAAGPYVISWVNDSEGSVTVLVTDDDAVSVYGNVDPTLTFDIDVSTATAGDTAAPYAIDFGQLDFGTPEASDNSDLDSIWLDFETNATGGGTIFVRSANAALKSASTGDQFASAGASLAANSEEYGICVDSTIAFTPRSGHPGGETFAAQGNFATGASCDGGISMDVGLLTTSDQALMAAAGPIDAGRVQVRVGMSVASSTPAHPDYRDVLTFTAVSTY